jgi:hypothetical protein
MTESGGLYEVFVEYGGSRFRLGGVKWMLRRSRSVGELFFFEV